jgi:hypothetical protein
MRLNGFIGIPTVTSLFYSKDSIIETLNKCWVTKELHALWSWIEINVFSLTLFTFVFYFSNILEWEHYIRDAKEPSYFVYNKSNVLYQMDLRSLHIDITTNLIMSTLGHMYWIMDQRSHHIDITVYKGEMKGQVTWKRSWSNI